MATAVKVITRKENSLDVSQTVLVALPLSEQKNKKKNGAAANRSPITPCLQMLEMSRTSAFFEAVLSMPGKSHHLIIQNALGAFLNSTLATLVLHPIE